VELERAHQMFTFLCNHYEPTGQSTFLAAIHQEQLLHQGDATIDAFFDQLSAAWHQIDTLDPQLSPATCQSCKDQKATLELRRTYDFLTHLHDEFEHLRAQLLAHHPCVLLMDALVEVCKEETHLQDPSLLWVSSILVARSSVARPVASVPPASPLVAPSTARGASTDLHYDHCGRDEHVDVFCYRKKKAQKTQAHRFSQVTDGSSSGGSERSSAGSETHELLMLLHHLAASTSSRFVGSVTQASALTGFVTSSQSSTLGPPSTPCPVTYP
jgi:hypothetical protein